MCSGNTTNQFVNYLVLYYLLSFKLSTEGIMSERAEGNKVRTLVIKDF
jgi:hypothetical protein